MHIRFNSPFLPNPERQGCCPHREASPLLSSSQVRATSQQTVSQIWLNNLAVFCQTPEASRKTRGRRRPRLRRPAVPQPPPKPCRRQLSAVTLLLQHQLEDGFCPSSKPPEVSADKHSFPGGVSFYQDVIKLSRLGNLFAVEVTKAVGEIPSELRLEPAGAGAGDGGFWHLRLFSIMVPHPTHMYLHITLLPHSSPRENADPKPSPKILLHPTGYERFLFLAPHFLPLREQGHDKDTAFIATIRVSYLNSR